MKAAFWNERYDREDYVYGVDPNEFLRDELTRMKPGKLLLAGEGEGRNAVFAAKLGWEVHAFDQSSVARDKALSLAKANNVTINYQVASVENYEPMINNFDVVGLIYFHMPSGIRNKIHIKLRGWLAPGGKVILEAFNKKQLHNNSGGPKNLEWLFDSSMLQSDFEWASEITIFEEEVILNEGEYHSGKANVIRMIAQNDET